MQGAPGNRDERDHPTRTLHYFSGNISFSESRAEAMNPHLYLVSRPSFDIDRFLDFLARSEADWRRTPTASEAEEIVEAAGRVCYMSFGARQSSKTTSEYILNLVTQGHESVLEHVNWGFVLSNVSRSFTHQLVRHRVGFAFSQLSQQYHEETDADFIEPSAIRALPTLSKRWREATEQARQVYEYALTTLATTELGHRPAWEAREILRAIRTAARSILPNATATTVFFTANARAIRHFLNVRGAIVGDEEMRRVSALLLDTVSREAPSLFVDFSVEVGDDGIPIVKKTTPAANSDAEPVKSTSELVHPS